jgi:hypothetical protein
VAITNNKNPKNDSNKPINLIISINISHDKTFIGIDEMPVFARTKLLMEEFCVTYRPRLELIYSGPNPQKAYPKIIDTLLTVLRVPRENIQEKEFNWDRSKPEEKFKITWEVIKNYDKFSYMLIVVDMSGSVRPGKAGKEGKIRVEIEGVVRTEYPQDTMWQRSFFYEMFRMFYHKVFYQEQRKRHVDSCRDSMLSLQAEIKSFFNLLPKVV